MNDDEDEEEGDDAGIEINCLDVSVDAQGAVTSLVVTSDGESFRSYVTLHKRIDRAGAVLHEVDSWCHSLWRHEDGPIYVVDNDGILHSNERGGRFRRTDLKAPMGLQRIREAAGRLVVCGAEGVVLQRGPNGWQSIGRAGDQDLEGVASTDDGALIVVGDVGLAARIDDQGWHDLHLPTNATLLAAQALAGGDVAIGGENGQFFVGRGTQWRPVDPAPSVHGMCRYGDSVAVAAAGAGVQLFDGYVFTPLKGDIDAQSIAASGRFLAVAAGDAVWCFNGKTWGHRTFSF